jgi:hypothetical protein
MIDPETIVVKGGIVILASLTVLRLIVRELRSLGEEFTQGRRRRDRR